MKILFTAPRSLAGYFFARSIRISIKPCIKAFIAALILMFAGNAYAVIEVGLAIVNDLDSNGNITVIKGGKVKVAYTVIEDTDKDLNMKDKIQLRRFSDDSLVFGVERGKKKSGTVLLKVKSEEEQLYVRYVRKNGTEVERISHPSDLGFIPLLSISKASLAELTIGLNALESVALTSAFFSGDGSAGDLTISSSLNWNNSPPSNPNFANIIIDAGQTLSVPAGTTIRCSGEFTNNGTIAVTVGVRSNARGFNTVNDVTSQALSFPHPGDSFGPATVPDWHNNGAASNVTADGGLGGRGIPQMSAISNFRSFKYGGGSGTGHSTPGAGGGLLRIYCSGDIFNAGTITANGGNGGSNGGGGGGSIVVLASRTLVDNTAGTILANGGNGGSGLSWGGAGGGGGGGIVMFIAPTVEDVGGTVNMNGGTGGASSSTTATNVRTGGGGGGASGGNGGSGGQRSSSSGGVGSSGGAGYQVNLVVDPMSLLF